MKFWGKKKSPGMESFVYLGTQQPQDISDVRAKDRNKFLPVHLQDVLYTTAKTRSETTKDENDYMELFKADFLLAILIQSAQRKAGNHSNLHPPEPIETNYHKELKISWTKKISLSSILIK
jgi:hypothetical protein